MVPPPDPLCRFFVPFPKNYFELSPNLQWRVAEQMAIAIQRQLGIKSLTPAKRAQR